MEVTRPTIMEVDLEAFKYNIKQVQNYIGNTLKLMPVIKASAYGTHVNRAIDIISKFEIVAVATVDEAVMLRKDGFKNAIFILNQPYKDEIQKIIDYNITVGVCSEEFLTEIGKSKGNVKIHIEIETGMGRTGIYPDKISKFIEEAKKYNNIEIEGIYTHLSSADSDEEYTKGQLKSFNESVLVAKKILKNIKYVHCLASNGILNYLNSPCNIVRAGIILYGYESNSKTFEKIDLKPICKLKSKITLLKDVEKGESISYSRTFITSRKTKVATIPIGYADGLRRNLSNKGFVVIRGKRAPIIGNICMDGFMADVTDIENVNVGDDVYIWDNENVTVEEIASICGTINYEILSTISNRVPRVFI